RLKAIEEDDENDLDPKDQSDPPLDDLETDSDDGEIDLDDDSNSAEDNNEEDTDNDQINEDSTSSDKKDEKEETNDKTKKDDDKQVKETVQPQIQAFAAATSPSYLAKGMYHNDVIKLKKDLDKAGFHVVNNPNNFFGAQTEKQVKAFQSYYNLEVDGIAGNATFNKLNDIINSSLQKGKYHN